MTSVIRGFATRATASVPMFGVSDEAADVRGQAASDWIRDELASARPSLVCRFGSNELNIVIGYCYPPSIRNYLRYLTSQITNVGWSKGTIDSFTNNAGFFPGTYRWLGRYAEMMLDDIRYIDILGTWMKQEQLLNARLKHVKKIPIQDMEPYFHRRPWTDILAGKKILVVHPFETSIRQQYSRKALLFRNSQVLPDFELRTIKAVQSIGNNRMGYRTWFDALDFMKEQIDKCDFEIAILGCGAYGLSLGAHIKRAGKKAVHIGGATQLLFGIKGARWESRQIYRDLMNEHWIRPLPCDYPPGYEKVENGCYW